MPSLKKNASDKNHTTAGRAPWGVRGIYRSARIKKRR
jgi:hypothetical protein